MIVVEALTPAEVRVLNHLTTHLTLQEIAAELVVSRNTAKSQAASIYRKLGVSGRAEAVRRAREEGLLLDRAHPAAPHPVPAVPLQERRHGLPRSSPRYDPTRDAEQAWQPTPSLIHDSAVLIVRAALAVTHSAEQIARRQRILREILEGRATRSRRSARSPGEHLDERPQ